MTSLGDILAGALRETSSEVKEAEIREQVQLSAALLVPFLKALPAEVDPMKLVQILDNHIGYDLGSEVMRVLLGVPTKNVKTYSMVPINGIIVTQKIAAIKEVRSILGTGLRESKDFVESTDSMELSISDYRELKARVAPLGFTLIPTIS